MSVPRLLVMTAVPFSIARLQSNLNIYSCNKSDSNTMTNLKDSNKNQSNLTRLTVSTKQNVAKDKTNIRLMKKQNRVLKNRIASQVSREKAKIKKDLLEKQLLELQIEQMKIRLLNNELEVKQSKLEEENSLLKERLSQVINNPPVSMGENKTETFNHAEEVGSVSPIFHPHDSVRRVCEQSSDFEFSQLIDPESSTHFEKHQTFDAYNFLPEVAEKVSQKEPLCLENEINSFDDFDLIESMIFREGFDFYSVDSKNQTQFSDHEYGSTSSSMKTFHSEEKDVIRNENTLSLPEWTFDDLFEDVENMSFSLY